MDVQVFCLEGYVYIMYVRRDVCPGRERQLVVPGEGEGSIIGMMQTILGDRPIVPSVSPCFMKPSSASRDLSCFLPDCFQNLKFGLSLDELVISRLLLEYFYSRSYNVSRSAYFCF